MSSQEAQPSMSEEVSLKKQRTRKVKILLGAVAALCLLGAVGACAAVATQTSTKENPAAIEMMDSTTMQEREVEKQSIPEDTEVSPERGNEEGRPRPARARENPNFGNHPSCSSPVRNDTIPAAHIRGAYEHRLLRPTAESTSGSDSAVPPGYQQVWQCDEYEDTNRHHGRRHAFVDGGASFNQSDKAIYLPTCGYYYVYSQVLFGVAEQHTTNVFHNINVDQNCPHDAVTYMLQGKASIGKHEPNVDTARREATTFVSAVVKICREGKIWITIPDTDVPCCPYGKGTSTFMGAVLISKTNCEWPSEETLSMH